MSSDGEAKPDVPTQMLLKHAMALQARGSSADAERALREVLDREPAQVDALHGLAILTHQRGQTDEAISFVRRAIAARPREATLHNTLGVLLENQSRFADAAAAYQQAVALAPTRAIYFSNLALMLRRLGQTAQALAAYDQAIVLDPGRAETHFNRAEMLQDMRRADEAMEGYRRVIALQPDYTQAYVNLGTQLQKNDRRLEALAMYDKAQALASDLAEIYANKGLVLQDLGRVEEADAALRRANDLDPTLLPVSGLMILQYYRQGLNPLEIRQNHQSWAEKAFAGIRRRAVGARRRRDGRKLRVGYVSGDFALHPVAFFAEPLFRGHDRASVELFLYSQHDPAKADAFTQHFRSLANHWAETFSMGDEELIARIAGDAIDVLVDLAGYTAGNRLPVFAARAAPVQVSYLGYPGTTGLAEMDFRLTDALLDPPGSADAGYTERLYRLPRTFACYSPPAVAPALSPPPAGDNGIVTFGVVTRPAKASSAALDLWANVLKAVPGARLRLMGYSDDPAMWQDAIAGLSARGISSERISIFPKMSLAQYMTAHREFDIVLDSFPFNGHTTTCHALWMGVPVVTLAGDAFASRLGLSVLTNVGLADLVAATPEQFVQIAVALAADVARLKEIRAGLRDRLRASPLMDGAALARNVEKAYREMVLANAPANES